jgi:AraC family transcriptional regulator
MIAALDGSLPGCRNPSSCNGRQARPTPFDSLCCSVNPPQPGLLGGIGLWRHINPSPRAIGALRTDELHCELLKVTKDNAAEMEFLLASHLIILFPDGVSGGCEWGNGDRAGKSPSMPPNTVIFNPARDYFWLRKRSAHGSYRLLLLAISPTAVNRLSAGNLDATNVKFVQRIGMNDENVRRTLLAFLQEIENPGWNSKFYAETLLTVLLNQLIRCASNLTGCQRAPYRKGGLAGWRLKRALELLEGNLREVPSLAELAHHIRLRPTSFCRAFKQSMGLSPHQYLLSHRIDCAKEMMRDQARSLTEIALACGFSGSSHFSVAFRRVVGTSPREYRRSL